jgi:hypothetical protein
MKTEIARAIDLIKGSRYIRLYTPNGDSRIARAAAIAAVIDTTRCRDCIGGDTRCGECENVQSDVQIQGHFIHLGRGAILHI